jgi:hypothetical protein
VLDWLRSRLSKRTKAMLDRRYARNDQIVELAVRLLEGRVTQLEDQIRGLVARVSAGDAFVGSGDPHEMRKTLFNASRMADECSRAIEHLLQADIILRRDLDSIV